MPQDIMASIDGYVVSHGIGVVLFFRVLVVSTGLILGLLMVLVQ